MVSKIRPNVWPFVSKGPDLQTHWPGPWIYLVQWRYTMFFFGKEKKSGTQAVRGASRNFFFPEQTVVHYEYAMTKSNLSTGPVQGQYAKQYIDCTNPVHDRLKYCLGTEAVWDRVPLQGDVRYMEGTESVQVRDQYMTGLFKYKTSRSTLSVPTMFPTFFDRGVINRSSACILKPIFMPRAIGDIAFHEKSQTDVATSVDFDAIKFIARLDWNCGATWDNPLSKWLSDGGRSLGPTCRNGTVTATTGARLCRTGGVEGEGQGKDLPRKGLGWGEAVGQRSR